ncbi:MAG: rhomboid family intramembrane serine protease [Cyclobacteriaceae bacterium]
MFNLTPMVKNILIINVVLLIIESFLSIDLSGIFGVHYVFGEDFFIFQYVTYMWLHAGMWHLFSNMFAVLIFGPMLERVWGQKRFLTFYLITGIGAGLLYGVVDTIEKNDIKAKAEVYSYSPNPDDFSIFIVNNKASNFTITHKGRTTTLAELSDEFYDNPNDDSLKNTTTSVVEEIYRGVTRSNMVGASGAVFGILLAFAILFPNTELLLLFPPIPIKAKYLVLFYGLYELYSEFNRSAGDNVAHLAHLSGMLIAFIILKYWQRTRGNFY